eukprot:Seg1297.6 transcript_id=Seg1297.6/GoldUCD/mRNA.D3Y31 product="hypothetical protein" protein_id=Seg1297.6/GoldUCD/D3Y31
MAANEEMPTKPTIVVDDYDKMKCDGSKKTVDCEVVRDSAPQVNPVTPIKFEIIVKPAVKSPPSISMSPLKPAPATVRCKLAEERRKSQEQELKSRLKERDEKILIAQKIKNESEEMKQRARKDLFEKKIKTSEEILAMQTQEKWKKAAAKARRLEEARKIAEENVAAKVKDAEQKLAKESVVSVELREKNLQKIIEKQQEHARKIKEAKEKVEQQERELRKEIEQKEITAQKKREELLEERKEQLRKQLMRVEERAAIKKREKESQG